jgi:hypothetical protein
LFSSRLAWLPIIISAWSSIAPARATTAPEIPSDLSLLPPLAGRLRLHWSRNATKRCWFLQARPAPTSEASRRTDGTRDMPPPFPSGTGGAPNPRIEEVAVCKSKKKNIEQDAKGRFARNKHGAKNTGLASAEPRTVSRNGDATFDTWPADDDTDQTPPRLPKCLVPVPGAVPMSGWRLITVTRKSDDGGWYYRINIGGFRRPRRGPYETKTAALTAGRRERARLERAQV